MQHQYRRSASLSLVQTPQPNIKRRPFCRNIYRTGIGRYLFASTTKGLCCSAYRWHGCISRFGRIERTYFQGTRQLSILFHPMSVVISVRRKPCAAATDEPHKSYNMLPQPTIMTAPKPERRLYFLLILTYYCTLTQTAKFIYYS